MLEYGKAVNFYIDKFWENTPKKYNLSKEEYEYGDTWLTARMKKSAAREAVDMINYTKSMHENNDIIPKHKCKHMILCSDVISFQYSKHSSKFEVWLHLRNIGKKIILDLPIKLHKHFHILQMRGKRLNYFIINKNEIEFVFEIETGPKKTEGKMLGIDTGINVLASTSEGDQFGRDIKTCVERIKRCKHGSRGQKRARRAAKQRMDEVAKEVVGSNIRLVVVEKLKNLNKNTKVKRRLTKNMRRSIGNWTYGYWLEKLQRVCEDRRSSFRTVSPYNTSVTCPSCGYVDRRNRNREEFKCRECGYADNADINAAKNILDRFLTGPYGAGFKSGEELKILVN